MKLKGFLVTRLGYISPRISSSLCQQPNATTCENLSATKSLIYIHQLHDRTKKKHKILTLLIRFKIQGLISIKQLNFFAKCQIITSTSPKLQAFVNCRHYNSIAHNFETFHFFNSIIWPHNTTYVFSHNLKQSSVKTSINCCNLWLNVCVLLPNITRQHYSFHANTRLKILT